MLRLASSDGKPSTQTYLQWAALGAGAAYAVYALCQPASHGRAHRHPTAKGVLVTDFDAFLTEIPSVPTGLDKPKANAKDPRWARTREGHCGGPFECFLLDDDDQVVAPAPAAAKPVDETPDPSMARVLVLYGTEYGFSKEIAQTLAGKLKATKAFWPAVVNMADHPEGYDFSSEQAVLVACSTQGDGVPPYEAREFCDWLFAGGSGSLVHCAFSVLALGDRNYAHFCKCGTKIDEALGRWLGALRFVDRVDVNKEDYPVVHAWVDAVIAALPSLSLKTYTALGIDVTANGHANGHANGTGPVRWGKSRPYPAKVVALEGLCTIASADNKNTVRVEFDLRESGIVYAPGDALGVFATNPDSMVSELLAAAGGLDGKASVAVPSHHYSEEGGEAAPGASLTLSAALTKCYDLREPRPQQLFAALVAAGAGGAAAELASGDDAARTAYLEQLFAALVAAGAGGAAAELASGDDAARTACLEGRHTADAFRELLPAGAKLSASELLACLRPLQPRLYSISSSPLEKDASVQATIAEVKYKAHGVGRVGICSTFVSERLVVGDTVHVYVTKNPDFRLPPSDATPIIMVGPGTGLAPFRAFIQQRLRSSKASGASCGQMVLYFGCRRSDQDYLYGPQLEAWAASGDLTLLTAFSRQSDKKVYVQDRLAESADLVWSLINDKAAHFYVCGDAASMAGSVEKQLLAIFGERLGGGADAAQAYLDTLSREERYQRDVWY
ncbi:hypothetical protein FOA52_013326 [Chlamydomonas sp. UWO 241]|nr:hypothetical protein FOA52_013326 [Chlamydomonas sp. UWO 241]